MAPAPTPSGPTPSADQAAPRGEVIDFLKTVVVASEGHLRALDTKAQIALAAFVLSWNPLWSMINSPCRQGVAMPVILLLVAAIVLSIAAYGYSVWPGSVSGTSSLFYIGSTGMQPKAYLQSLQDLRAEIELAREAVVLAAIRRYKQRRLRLALLASVVSYLTLAGVLFVGRYCV